MTQTENAAPAAKGGAKDYYGDQITVRFDLARCLHVGVCVRSIPAVFDTKRRPWVLPDAGDADQIAAVIRRCPSGALHYEFTDPSQPVEQGHQPVCVRTADGEPLWFEGEVEIANNGKVISETRGALCRCGSTANRPFCDASGPCVEWRHHPH
ncbi:MAG: (4Fe-4S)-binding protein [Bifidobacteriaceae bacterium]|nr:(4Fe-4S)-binding protein [Bifidobacteriaceae bacterium]